jgi:SAM-dependent methyltransferase
MRKIPHTEKRYHLRHDFQCLLRTGIRTNEQKYQEELTMADSSHPTGDHHHNRQGEQGHQHGHGSHDWSSPEYVAKWMTGQDPKEADRRDAFGVLADTIPYDKAQSIRILDLGAGYGALTQFLLERFPNATAICQDGSQEMAKLSSERMQHLTGRFEYVFCDFSRHGWSKVIPGTFDAVVSSIAIHNVRSPDFIRGIYEESYKLVKPGGCFLNFDRPRPPWEDQMQWLRIAGFQDVKIFWQGENRAVFGGFRK